MKHMALTVSGEGRKQQNMDYFRRMASPASLLSAISQQSWNHLDLQLQRQGPGRQMAALRYNPVWLSPGQGLPPPCADRVNHTYPAPPPPTPCTSVGPPGFVNARLLPTGIPNPRYARRQCDNSTTRHGPGHIVCFHCNHMSENLHWYKCAVARIVKEPAIPPVDEHNTRWHGFLTRMCMLCEQREQFLIAARVHGTIAGIAPFHPPATQQVQMAAYPFNTCTCLYNLQKWRLCRDHRKDHWDDLRLTPGQMVQRRNANKRWLFETAEYNPAGVGIGLRTANDARRFNRMSLAPGFGKRGCRCGREVTTVAPVVLQCMACEGIIQLGPTVPPLLTTLSVVAVLAAAPTGPQLINSASVGAPLRMSQARSPLPW